jgi:hypothetical protein
VLKLPARVNVLTSTPDDQVLMAHQYRRGLGRADFELCGRGANPAFPGSASHNNPVHSFPAEGIMPAARLPRRQPTTMG